MEEFGNVKKDNVAMVEAQREFADVCGVRGFAHR